MTTTTDKIIMIIKRITIKTDQIITIQDSGIIINQAMEMTTDTKENQDIAFIAERGDIGEMNVENECQISHSKSQVYYKINKN